VTGGNSAKHSVQVAGERKAVGFGGGGGMGGDKGVMLARELWEFDAKHRMLAKDLERYIHGGKVRPEKKKRRVPEKTEKTLQE
jgi:hypothetical protein